MNIVNRICLKLENYEKCELHCDVNCPLGELYDYSCVLQSFIINKIKEAEAAKKALEEKKEDVSNG